MGQERFGLRAAGEGGKNGSGVVGQEADRAVGGEEMGAARVRAPEVKRSCPRRPRRRRRFNR